MFQSLNIPLPPSKGDNVLLSTKRKFFALLRMTATVVFITSCTLFSFAQKVGLVLSGGGSSGMVHIGVLKALEENNIPVDYIAGTSAGGLVGGAADGGAQLA